MANKCYKGAKTVTKNKRENPQRILSKNLLTHALIELMNEIPYNQINVTILTKKADISRRTFYRHFSTIDETLDFILHQVTLDFQQFQAEKAPTNFKALIYVYFLYWNPRKDFLHILKDNGLLYCLQNKLLPATPSKDIDTSRYSIEINDIIINFAMSFTSGAVWSLLVKWLEGGAIQSPEEMAEIAENVILHLTQK